MNSIDLTTAEQKEEALLRWLRSCGRIAVAYSGGVDSTYLLYATAKALGGNSVAVTIQNAVVPARERDEASSICKALGVRQITTGVDPLRLPEFVMNDRDRCYVCKKYMFSEILRIAKEEGTDIVVEGANMDDENDFRPGARAIKELGVQSPLRDAGLYKEEIRALSKEAGLPTWDKPSYACLATRIAYGENITEEKLRRVEQAEDMLIARGFRQMRVRTHGDLARIEVPEEDIARIASDAALRREIQETFRTIGFAFVSLDLGGFRSGSMNQGISN